MANLFDAVNAPEGSPKEIVVGDFIQFKRTDLVADYPPADYTARYIARVTQGGSSEITLTGTNYNSGESYLFTVTSTDSADFDAGYYHWQLEIERNSDNNRIVVDRGSFTAIVDLDVNNTDPRTHDEKMLTKIQSILENRADSDVESYSIQGRSLTKIPIKELIEWERHYRQRVDRQKRADDIRLGRKTSNTIKVRF